MTLSNSLIERINAHFRSLSEEDKCKAAIGGLSTLLEDSCVIAVSLASFKDEDDAERFYNSISEENEANGFEAGPPFSIIKETHAAVYPEDNYLFFVVKVCYSKKENPVYFVIVGSVVDLVSIIGTTSVLLDSQLNAQRKHLN